MKQLIRHFCSCDLEADAEGEGKRDDDDDPRDAGEEETAQPDAAHRVLGLVG